MLAYQQWLGALPPVRQYELRNIGDPAARVARVKEWATRMRDDELLALTDDELKALFSELSGPIKHLRSEITKDDSDKADDRDRLKLLLSQDFAKWRNELIEQFGYRGRGTFNWKVTESLPGRSRSRFNGLSPENKVERFLTWMRQHTACRGEISEEELEHFFAEELNPDTRAQLLSLPPGVMEQALRRMYKCQPKQGAEGRWTWSPTLNTFVSETTAPAASAPDNRDEKNRDDDRRNGDNGRRGRGGDGRDGNDGNDGNGRRGDGRGDNGGRGYNERPQGGFGERPQRPPMEFAPGQNGPGRRPGFGGPPFGPPPMNPDRRGTFEERPLDPPPADAASQP